MAPASWLLRSDLFGPPTPGFPLGTGACEASTAQAQALKLLSELRKLEGDLDAALQAAEEPQPTRSLVRGELVWAPQSVVWCGAVVG